MVPDLDNENQSNLSGQGDAYEPAQRNTNTQGGDYAENTVDKRQGNFVEGNQYNISIRNQSRISLPIWIIAVVMAIAGSGFLSYLAMIAPPKLLISPPTPIVENTSPPENIPGSAQCIPNNAQQIAGVPPTVTPIPGANPDEKLRITFNEGRGLWAVDHSGNNNHGWLIGSFDSAYQPGKEGAGLYFDGASTVCVNDHPSLRFTQQLYIDVWLRPGVIDNKTRNIVAKISKTDAFAYRLFLRDGQPIFAVYSEQGDGELVAQQKLELHTWSHLFASYDGIKMTMTLNDNQIAEKPFNHTIRPSHAWLEIGSSSYRNEFFLGDIDEVIIAGR